MKGKFVGSVGFSLFNESVGHFYLIE